MSKTAPAPAPAPATDNPAARLSDLAKNSLASMRAAMAEKGAARARAVTRVKDGAAQAITFALAAPAAAQAQAQVAVRTVTTTRGTEFKAVTQVKALDLLRSLAYGGTLIGSARIDFKSTDADA